MRPRGMERHVLMCLACGRVLGEAAAPALATVVGGATRAVCADCIDRPAARHQIAALLGVRPADLASILAAPAPPGPAEEVPAAP